MYSLRIQIVCGLARPTMHLPHHQYMKLCFYGNFFMCFLILDRLKLNKLLCTTSFQPLYLLCQQTIFPDFWGGNKNMNGNIFVLKYHKYTKDH